MATNPDFAANFAAAKIKMQQLIEILKRTDQDAQSANVEHFEGQLDNIRAQMAEQSKVISGLETEIREIQIKITKSANSSFKRLAIKVKGKKAEEKASVESEKLEHELQESQKKVSEAKGVRESMFSVLRETEQEKKGAIEAKEENKKASKDLEDLLDSVFSGHTPSVPGEDILEDKVQKLQTRLNNLGGENTRNKQAFKFLSDATRCLADVDTKLTAAAPLYDEERQANANGKKLSASKQHRLNIQQVMIVEPLQQDAEKSKWYYQQAAALQPLIPQDPYAGHEDGFALQEQFMAGLQAEKFIIFDNSAALYRWLTARIKTLYLEQEQRTLDVQKEHTETISALHSAKEQLFNMRWSYLDQFLPKGAA